MRIIDAVRYAHHTPGLQVYVVGQGRGDESQRDVGGCWGSFRTSTYLGSKPTQISFGLNLVRVLNRMQF